MLEQYYNKETQTLTFPWYFDEELCDLPLDTKVIIFGENNKFHFSEFNRPVNNLPNSITHLTFGEQFNQPVGHQGCEDINCPRNLPNSITHLTFGYIFNQPVNNLPNSITHLTFEGRNFNQPVGHQGCEDINCPRNLPNSITHLIFGDDFNQPVNKLPNSITHLTFGYCFNQPVDNLPNLITHFTFGFYFNQKVGHQECEDINCPRNLPNSITHLTFGKLFNQPVDKLPNSITHLTFGDYSKFNQLVDYLPNSITHLTFGYYFNKPLDNLPLFLQQIKFNTKSKEEILSIIKKIPFECKILNENDEEIFLQ
jgi:hypothetical protein